MGRSDCTARCGSRTREIARPAAPPIGNVILGQRILLAHAPFGVVGRRALAAAPSISTARTVVRVDHLHILHVEPPRRHVFQVRPGDLFAVEPFHRALCLARAHVAALAERRRGTTPARDIDLRVEPGQASRRTFSSSLPISLAYDLFKDLLHALLRDSGGVLSLQALRLSRRARFRVETFTWVSSLCSVRRIAHYCPIT